VVQDTASDWRGRGYCVGSWKRNDGPAGGGPDGLRRVGGDMIDDALDEDDVHMNVAGDAGHELGDEVVDGRGGQVDAVALGVGREMGFLAGHIEVRDGDVEDGSDDLGVVDGVSAVVGLLPEGLVDAMEDAARNAEVGTAMVVRIGAGDGGNQEGAKELIGHVLGEVDPGQSAPAGKSRAVRRVRIGSDFDACLAENCGQVPGINEVIDGETEFLLGRKAHDCGAADKAGVPVEEFGVLDAGLRLDRG